MSRRVIGPLWRIMAVGVAIGLMQSKPLIAQAMGGMDGHGDPRIIAVHGDVDAVARMLDGLHALTPVLLSAAASDGEVSRRLGNALRDGASAPDEPVEWEGRNLSNLRVGAVFARADQLRREMYAALALSDLADRAGAVERAIDGYLARADLALSAVPKSMDVLDAQRGSASFRSDYPSTNALLWSFQWLQLAVFEPLLVYAGEEDRTLALQAISDRFGEMVSGVGRGTPSHMPMAPAIAPEFVTRHPRAAAIFDNLNMLRHGYLDLVAASPGGSVPASALDGLVDRFTDPGYYAIDELDWIVMSLRHGIYAQGGPAIGRMERPERNDSHHGAHTGDARMPMPGM